MSRCESRIDTVSGSESHAEIQFFFSNSPEIECSPIVFRSVLVTMIGVGSFIPRLVMSRGQIEFGLNELVAYYTPSDRNGYK